MHWTVAHIHGRVYSHLIVSCERSKHEIRLIRMPVLRWPLHFMYLCIYVFIYFFIFWLPNPVFRFCWLFTNGMKREVFCQSYVNESFALILWQAFITGGVLVFFFPFIWAAANLRHQRTWEKQSRCSFACLLFPFFIVSRQFFHNQYQSMLLLHAGDTCSQTSFAFFIGDLAKTRYTGFT